MPVLIRKIDKGKWLQNDILEGEDVSADAITHCMRTDQNTLSTWMVDSEEEASVDEAVLAMAANFDHLESIDVVLMSSAYLQENGVSCVQTKGLTPVNELEDTHRDLADLSYEKLGVIASHVVDGFREDRVIRYTKGHLKRLLREAIVAGRLTANDLKSSVQSKL